MYTINVNNSSTFKSDLSVSGTAFSGTLDGKAISGDFIRINDHLYHFIYENKSYNIEVIKLNAEEKSIVLKVNSQRCVLSLKDKYDELLHRLGLDKLMSGKINEIKAPMPGMVLKIMVKEGDEVKKGDPLIVLEAMKMENIIKSPGDATIKRIAASQGSAVEKNQILIQF